MRHHRPDPDDGPDPTGDTPTQTIYRRLERPGRRRGLPIAVAVCALAAAAVALLIVASISHTLDRTNMRVAVLETGQARQHTADSRRDQTVARLTVLGCILADQAAPDPQVEQIRRDLGCPATPQATPTPDPRTGRTG
jgi:hypothetical protein